MDPGEAEPQQVPEHHDPHRTAKMVGGVAGAIFLLANVVQGVKYLFEYDPNDQSTNPSWTAWPYTWLSAPVSHYIVHHDPHES